LIHFANLFMENCNRQLLTGLDDDRAENMRSSNKLFEGEFEGDFNGIRHLIRGFSGRCT